EWCQMQALVKVLAATVAYQKRVEICLKLRNPLAVASCIAFATFFYSLALAEIDKEYASFLDNCNKTPCKSMPRPASTPGASPPSVSPDAIRDQLNSDTQGLAHLLQPYLGDPTQIPQSVMDQFMAGFSQLSVTAGGDPSAYL